MVVQLPDIPELRENPELFSHVLEFQVKNKEMPPLSDDEWHDVMKFIHQYEGRQDLANKKDSGEAWLAAFDTLPRTAQETAKYAFFLAHARELRTMLMEAQQNKQGANWPELREKASRELLKLHPGDPAIMQALHDLSLSRKSS